MSEHRFYLGEPTNRLDVGSGVALLFFGPNSHEPHGIGVEHVCGRWPDDQEPDGEFVKIVAPALHPNHVVTKQGGGFEPFRYTIRASIACPDCGLHGYVTDNEWKVA